MHISKMKNDKMHKSEIPQIQQNRIPVSERGERELEIISPLLCISPTSNPLNKTNKINKLTRFIEGRTRVVINSNSTLCNLPDMKLKQNNKNITLGKTNRGENKSI